MMAQDHIHDILLLRTPRPEIPTKYRTHRERINSFRLDNLGLDTDKWAFLVLEPALDPIATGNRSFDLDRSLAVVLTDMGKEL